MNEAAVIGLAAYCENHREALLGRLRDRSPKAAIFLSNCPMIKLSPAIPQPIKGILWELSKMHDANIAEVTGTMRFEREVELHVSDQAKVGRIIGATAIRD